MDYAAAIRDGVLRPRSYLWSKPPNQAAADTNRLRNKILIRLPTSERDSSFHGGQLANGQFLITLWSVRRAAPTLRRMTTTNWNFDLAHSSVNFHVRHLMVSKVHGRFSLWGGTLEIDNDDITRSRVHVTIDAASVDTKEDKRDAHLRSPEFFDVAKFPALTFKSTQIAKVSDDELAITGDLTLHGVTKSVTLAVELGGQANDPWGGIRTGFSARTTINRKDFGLGWNTVLEAGGVLVGEKIEITLEIEAVQAAAVQAA